MKKIFTAFFILVLNGMLSFAQNNFQLGTITDNAGQTKSGQIDYLNWDQNPTKILFKDKAGKISTLGLADLSSFEVQRGDKVIERFQKAVLKVDNSSSKFELFDSNPQPDFVMDTSFLMVLVEGEFNLYFLKTSDNEVHYFISNDTTEIAELVQKDYFLNGTNQIGSNNKYRLQLARFAAACPAGSITPTNKLAFNERALIDYVNKLNKCSGAENTFNWKPERNHSYFYLQSGVAMTRIIEKALFSSESFRFRKNSPMFYSPTLGIGKNWTLPRTNERVLLSNELMYHNMKVSYKTVIENAAHTTWTEYNNEYRLNYLRMNSSFIWIFHQGKPSLYSRFGISNAVLLNHKLKGTRSTRIIDTGEITYQINYQPFRENDIKKHELGFMIGIGAALPRPGLSFELKSILTNGFSNHQDFPTTIEYFNFLVGYQF